MVLTAASDLVFPMCREGASRERGNVVRAINVDGVTRTFTAEKNTRREAVELAKSLREQGLWVIIVGPDGKVLEDETKEDP